VVYVNLLAVIQVLSNHRVRITISVLFGVLFGVSLHYQTFEVDVHELGPSTGRRQRGEPRLVGTTKVYGISLVSPPRVYTASDLE
jgi:hypothetical protein